MPQRMTKQQRVTPAGRPDKAKEKERGNGNGTKPIATKTAEVQPTAVKESNTAVKEPSPVEVKVQVDQLQMFASENKMVEEFVCRICLVHVVGCGPKLTRCSHLFCGDCVSKWFSSHTSNLTWAQRAKIADSATIAPCPVCKEQLHEQKDLFSVSPTEGNESAMLWRMLSGLKMACANHPSMNPSGKCDWVGQYGNYQKHIAKCKNLPMSEAKALSSPPVAPVAKSVGTEKPKELSTSPSASNSQEQATTCDGTDTSSRMADADSDGDVSEFNLEAPCQNPVQDTQCLPAPILSEPKPEEAELQESLPEEDQTNQDTVEQNSESQPSTDSSPALIASTNEAPEPIALSIDEEVKNCNATCDLDCQDNLAAPEPEVQELLDLPSEKTVEPVEFVKPVTVEPKGATMNDLKDSLRLLFELKLQQHTGAPVAAATTEAALPQQAQRETAPRPAPVQHQEETPEQIAPCKSRVTTGFSTTNPTQLSLVVGDFVEIIERHSSGWTYGRKLCTAQPEGSPNATCLAEGWFPEWTVRL